MNSVATLPERIAVAELDFEVQVSARRRSIGITIGRDGGLILSAPPDCQEAEITAFALGKRMWVYKKLAEKDLLVSERPVKEFVSGEGFRYLGRSYRLLVTDGEDEVMLVRGRLLIPREVVTCSDESQAMIDWYRARATHWLRRRVKPWATRMGVAPTGIEVRDLGYRWGSLGKRGRVNFHWATIQLSPTLVDYVIVHELAHMAEPNHSTDFWLRVERALPTFLATKTELARIGGRVWLGDTVRAAQLDLPGRAK
jgi:predicted metal-dependent hydrolase